MSEFTPLLNTSPSPSPDTSVVIPPIFLDLESQPAHPGTREEQEEDSLRRSRRRADIDTAIAAAAVGVGVLMIGLLAFFGGMAAKRGLAGIWHQSVKRMNIGSKEMD
ncbi:hypothetical protein HOY80DRAFT_1133565 [Tuber brumale]|nr:hypothetical protein HOY80DRAFT_1133565 [Tuber brumale]